ARLGGWRAPGGRTVLPDRDVRGPGVARVPARPGLWLVRRPERQATRSAFGAARGAAGRRGPGQHPRRGTDAAARGTGRGAGPWHLGGRVPAGGSGVAGGGRDTGPAGLCRAL